MFVQNEVEFKRNSQPLLKEICALLKVSFTTPAAVGFQLFK